MSDYWLMKSEPGVFSFDDLKNAPNSTTHWDGVRDYQARNFMRDQMQVGDLVLYYHSNCDEPGVVGIARSSKQVIPILVPGIRTPGILIPSRPRIIRTGLW